MNMVSLSAAPLRKSRRDLTCRFLVATFLPMSKPYRMILCLLAGVGDVVAWVQPAFA